MIQNLSIPSVEAATFYVALLALGALVLGLLVVRERVKTKTGLGDGGHAGLAQIIRVHGNYVENVPFGLALLIMLAVTNPSAWPVHVVGLCLIVGRIAHAVGVSQSSGPNRGRLAGMMLTWVSLTFGAVSLLGRLI
jgi:uncharacterized protein